MYGKTSTFLKIGSEGFVWMQDKNFVSKLIFNNLVVFSKEEKRD